MHMIQVLDSIKYDCHKLICIKVKNLKIRSERCLCVIKGFSTLLLNEINETWYNSNSTPVVDVDERTLSYNPIWLPKANLHKKGKNWETGMWQADHEKTWNLMKKPEIPLPYPGKCHFLTFQTKSRMFWKLQFQLKNLKSWKNLKSHIPVYLKLRVLNQSISWLKWN